MSPFEGPIGEAMLVGVSRNTTVHVIVAMGDRFSDGVDLVFRSFGAESYGGEQDVIRGHPERSGGIEEGK